MLDHLNAIVLGAYGLLIGSFVNVLVHRLPLGLSVVRPRSHCPGCERTIAWYDNVPVVSYLVLGGRCRGCRARISPVYPLNELATGALFFAVGARWGLGPSSVLYCAFVAALVALFWIDLRWNLLPDVLTLGTGALGLIGSAWLPTTTPLESVLGVAVGAGSLLMARFGYWWLRGRHVARELEEQAEGRDEDASAEESLDELAAVEGIGLGDVKMLGMIGAWLGAMGALYVLVLGALAGSLVGIVAIVGLGRGRHFPLPLGSFLAVAAVVWLFWGDTILWHYTASLVRWLE